MDFMLLFAAVFLFRLTSSMHIMISESREYYNDTTSIERYSNGEYGVDVSQLTSGAVFSCLRSNGYSYVIVRAHHSNGGVDTNSVPTVANAWAAGMTHVDVYLFPCYTCGNPEGQVNETGQN
jgi:hypothetical protein